MEIPIDKQDRDWGLIKRNLWWLKYALVLATLWGVTKGFSEWVLTRASISYVDQEIATRESKEAAIEMRRKVDRNIETTTNIRENLLILLDRQKIVPVPMPSKTVDP